MKILCNISSFTQKENSNSTTVKGLMHVDSHAHYLRYMSPSIIRWYVRVMDGTRQLIFINGINSFFLSIISQNQFVFHPQNIRNVTSIYISKRKIRISPTTQRFISKNQILFIITRIELKHKINESIQNSSLMEIIVTFHKYNIRKFLNLSRLQIKVNKAKNKKIKIKKSKNKNNYCKLTL